MGLVSYKLGQTSVILRVKVFDSSVATGAGKTGLAYNSSGLIISTIADNEAAATTYTSAASHVEDISTLGTYAAPSASCCRFKEVDSTNHKGVYEIQFADARLAVSSAKSLLVSVSGVSGAAECDVVIPLTSIDPYDSVRAGLTALPNAAADAAGGLPISDAGGLDLDALLGILSNGTYGNSALKTLLDAIAGYIDTEVAAILADTDELQTDWTNGGRLDLLIDAIKAKTDLVPASPAAVGSAMTLEDDAITAAKFDESTAFPLKSADTGSTAVARTGSDSDTLETLSDQIDGISPPTTSDIADAVWDELLSGHTGAGSAGAGLSTASSAGDPWSTSLPGSYGSGTAGKIVGDNLNAPVGTVDTVVDGIASTLGSAGAGLTAVPWNASWDAEVQSECTDALNAYDPPTNAEMEARTLASASYSTLTAQQVWEYATRTLSSFGTLITDIWANATRTLTSISDSSGVTTLLSRIASALMITGGKVDVNDKTGFALTSAYDPAKTAAPAATALSNTTWTDAKAGYIDAAISTVGGGTAPTASEIADAVWDETVSGHLTTGTAGRKLNDLSSSAGSGSIEWDLPNIYETGTTTPIADVDVWITTDEDGDNVIASGKTDAYGTCKFYLDAGTVYVFCQKSGVNFDNPSEETVE